MSFAFRLHGSDKINSAKFEAFAHFFGVNNKHVILKILKKAENEVVEKVSVEYKEELGARLISQIKEINRRRSLVNAAGKNGNSLKNSDFDGKLANYIASYIGFDYCPQSKSDVGVSSENDLRRLEFRSNDELNELPTLNKDQSGDLFPIQVKVENAPSSPSTSYVEQQPSTSGGVSQSGAFGFRASSLNTPRSVSAGVESNVERAAKQEAQILARISELRRQGMWSIDRLPMNEMPPRNKTHWDYLLEEVRWMAVDFKQERNFKRHAAKKFATQLARVVRDKEMEVERAKQRSIKEAKRVCAFIARMIRDFWQNVDKVVDLRAQEVLDSMKRKALDQQLELMVGHANKLSEMVQEGLIAEKCCSRDTLDDENEDDDDENDDDYVNCLDESDDERTIAKEDILESDVGEETADLAKESEMDLDELLASLPSDYLASLSNTNTSNEKKLKRHRTDFKEKQSNEDDIESLSDHDDRIMRKRRRFLASEIPDDISTKESTGSVMSKNDEEIAEVDDETSVPPEEAKDEIMKINYDRLISENSEERQKELANIAEEALKFQPKGFTLETTQVKTEVPHLIRGVLREYQMVGLDWLVTLYERGLNGILADEMGLGKTIQTIALLAHVACKDCNWGPHLIVVPTSVILNWEIELKKWCPAFKILTYFGSQKERAEKRRGWSKPNVFHVCITSYKIITQDIRSFKQKAWQYFVLDEAQNIKNFKSQRWQMLLNVRARRRLLLTGTPLQNSLMELWSLMHFLMPAIFASHNDFKDWFSNPLTDMMEGNAEWNAPLVQRLHKVLRPFILRRLKTDVEKQLPEKTEHIVMCPLSKRQRYLYDDFMSQRTTRENLRSGNVMSVLNIVMQLRKCCNHPNLFEPRPIVSPFALRPIVLTFPAAFLDICNSDEDDQVPNVPECLLLNYHTVVSHFARSEACHLAINKAFIEAVNRKDELFPIPKRTGFRFCRQQPQKVVHSENSQKLSNSSQSSAELPGSSGFYVCVDNDGTARLYQMVISNTGERLIQECDPGMVASSAAVNHPLPACTINSDSRFDGIGLNCKSSVSGTNAKDTTQAQFTASVKTNVHRAMVGGSGEMLVNPAFRSRTILNRSNLQENRFALNQNSLSKNNGFMVTPSGEIDPNSQHIMKTETLRSSRHAQLECATSSTRCITVAPATAKKSGLLHLRTRALSPELIVRTSADDIRSSVLDRLFNINSRRLQSAVAQRYQLISIEILSILIGKLNKKFGARKRYNYLDDCDCRGLNDLVDKLNDWISETIQRFAIYVDGAVADAPTVCATSKGRPAYIREMVVSHSAACRKIFLGRDRLVAESLAMQKLQFPELRLIEYDCGKLQILSALLRDLFLYKHRCLIFTQMSRMLDILQGFLSFHGYQYFRLDGSTGIEQRQALMERFNADPKIFCFILSTRSGGIGVNLTGADTVIFYDSDWNPTMDAQAQDRCHRIGQTRNVTIYRLISERTIEENILRKAMQKRRLGELAIDEAGFTPEYFKGDNIRDLFDGYQLPNETITPISIADTAELEKAMATIEDVQDVDAARRANAEARAELAEFDESQQNFIENILEKADSKYLELINQLKPVERYAINLLEAEYKPDFEEEVKEAEAMIASKKDEWLKAQENVIDEQNEGAEADDFSLTYASGFNVPGSDEMVCLEFVGETMPIWMPLSPPASEVDNSDSIYYDTSGDYWYKWETMVESELPTTIHELHRPRPPVTVINTSTNITSNIPGSMVISQNIQSLPSETPVNDGKKMDAQRQKLINSATPGSTVSPPATVSSAIAQSSPVIPSVAMERFNFMSQSSTQNVIPYFDPSNLLRPGTPSRMSNSVDDAIDSVRKSAQKTSLINQFRTAYIGSSRCSDYRIMKEDARRAITPPPREREAHDYEGLPWLITDDYLLLKAASKEQQMPYHMCSTKAGHIVNWHFVSNYLFNRLFTYRSPRQCCVHYQIVIIPREDSRTAALDPITKKNKKVLLTHTELNHIKSGRLSTEQQYFVDVHKIYHQRCIQIIRPVKSLALKKLSLKNFSVVKLSIEGGSDKLAAISSIKSEYEIKEGDFSLIELIIKRDEKRQQLDNERQKLGSKDEMNKDFTNLSNLSEVKKVNKRESVVQPLPGVIDCQRFVSQASDEASLSTCTSNITIPIASVRSIGGPQSGVINSNSGIINTGINSVAATMCDSSHFNIGQRIFSDHQTTVTSGGHTGRRISLPSVATMQNQHTTVVNSNSQAAQTSNQQPYTVVVSSQDNIVTGGNQLLGTRFQYRQDVNVDRQTIYRAINPRVKSNTSASLQRVQVGYPVIPQQTSQMYSSTGHSGRAMIVSQTSDASTLSDSSQMQVMRPSLQSLVTPVSRQDTRSKITQRAQNRLYVTTQTGDRTYIMPQTQVRMLPGGQRIAQKRTFQSKALGAQQQVMMVPSRAGGMQQLRAISRYGPAYQTSRVQSVGLAIGGTIGRNSDIVATTNSRQFSQSVVPDQSTSSITLETTQSHSLPPISLSSQQTQQITTPPLSSSSPSTVDISSVSQASTFDRSNGNSPPDEPS